MIEQKPFNIELLKLNADQLKDMNQIKVLDIVNGSSKNLHPEGLFSTEYFGKMGEPSRYIKFAYINAKIPFFHPIIFKTLSKLKGLYEDIMLGKAYAVFDKKEKDFVRSSPTEGRTGFHFFMEHFTDLIFKENESIRRSVNIELLEKYRNEALLTDWLVIPAGFRDYEVDDNGQPSEDEINTFYRKMLSSSFTVDDVVIKSAPELINGAAISIQTAANSVYDYIMGMLEGKKKFILGKWAARSLFNGTMNVISSSIYRPTELHKESNFSLNQTMVGLFQYIKGILPVAVFQIRNEILSNIFINEQGLAKLINKKTLMPEEVYVHHEFYDEWMSIEGLERRINRFSEEELRHEILDYEDYYLAMVYIGPNKELKVIYDPKALPEGRSIDDCKPITAAELFYLSVFKYAHRYAAYLTRYPVAGTGSIFPTKLFLRTTVRELRLTMLDDDWNPTEVIAQHFPVRDIGFFNTIGPHPSRLAGLGADFDGDRCSLDFVYSDEAIAEVDQLLKSRKYYINLEGSFNASAETDTISYVLRNITGD